LIRSGRADFAILFRQYTSDDGSNPGSSSGAPACSTALRILMAGSG
jgi:hypothetical protein